MKKKKIIEMPLLLFNDLQKLADKDNRSLNKYIVLQLQKTVDNSKIK